MPPTPPMMAPVDPHAPNVAPINALVDRLRRGATFVPYVHQSAAAGAGVARRTGACSCWEPRAQLARTTSDR